MENARTRTSSYQQPKWWDYDKNGGWADCISTATSNYGEGNVVLGNQTFAKDYDKYGFRRLNNNEQPQVGDIEVYYNEQPYTPYHSVIVTGIDKDGKRRIAYSNGGGIYHNDADDYWMGPSRFYRFIGTPAERAEIAAHNAAVQKQRQEIYGNEKGEPQRIETPKQAVPTEKLDTLQFLDRIKKR